MFVLVNRDAGVGTACKQAQALSLLALLVQTGTGTQFMHRHCMQKGTQFGTACKQALSLLALLVQKYKNKNARRASTGTEFTCFVLAKQVVKVL